jgi:tetratricopeptide (TPR) repeat protein
VESVFHWSYRTLPVDAARLFRLLGLAPGADVDVYAAAALLAVSTAEAGRLLGELVRGHLLEEHSQRRFRFHDLLRIFAKRRAEAVDTQDERQRAIRRLVDYYLHTAYTAERLTDPLHDPVAIPLRAPEPGVSTKVFTTTTEALEWHAAESANLLAMVAYVDAHGWHEHAVQFARAMRTGCYIQARWRDYLTVYEVALRAANSIHHEPAQAICHASLAQVSAILSRFEVALDHAAQALRISGRLGDVSGQAFAHRAIAWIHGRSGAHADAIDHCLRGLDLYREVGNREGESDLLNGLGWSYAQLGRYEEALPVCEQAIEVARDIGQPRSEAPALDSLGYVNRSLGDYPRAMENYRLAIEKYTDLGMHHDVAGATNGLGDTYAATGDLPSALAAWRRAIDLLDDPDGPLTRAIHAKIAAGQPEA